VDKEFKWNAIKNDRSKKARGISFEELLKNKFIDIQDHPKLTHQRLMLFECRNKIWVVPFVENEKEIFLKTLYPSRKYTKMYRKDEI
jgi:hypothetical protein